FCHRPDVLQRFTNEDHLAVHKHKHEMTLKFGPARTDSVIIADQTPTPTRFLKNCEEVGLFNELASSFEQEFRKVVEDEEDKRGKPLLASSQPGALDMTLTPPSEVKVKEEEPVEVDSSPPSSPDSMSSSMSDYKEPQENPPKPAVSSAPTPTIVRPGSLPLHLGYEALQPTLPSPTSVITQAPPSNRQLGLFYLFCCCAVALTHSSFNDTSALLLVIRATPSDCNLLARPVSMVPNIPGIPGPPLGSSSGSSSPSGHIQHSEAKMRLKAALSQQAPMAPNGGGMAMGSSPMVPQRQEQSQLLVQHPDAPSPAQPQVEGTHCTFNQYTLTLAHCTASVHTHWSTLMCLLSHSHQHTNRQCTVPSLCKSTRSSLCTCCNTVFTSSAHPQVSQCPWLSRHTPDTPYNCFAHHNRSLRPSALLSGGLTLTHSVLSTPPMQVSPAQPTGGRRRRAADDDPDERRQRFLERNRAAASRCRQKRKLWVNSLEKKAEELTSMNVSLSNEVSLLRNEVAHLKQLLLAHKDCPVTTLQKKNAYLVGEESPKDPSEPTGSPAPVIQHSSLSSSPAAQPNGLSARAAAEAVAMSVLAGMGSQRAEPNPAHVIMAPQSQPAAR
ncbi:ATF7 factor, partial [Atractosteus spatula]|nr:ATF7 factor [Atractosteus spatula]